MRGRQIHVSDSGAGFRWMRMRGRRCKASYFAGVFKVDPRACGVDRAHLGKLIGLCKAGGSPRMRGRHLAWQAGAERQWPGWIPAHAG
jgi:hypothetical protein